MLLRNPGTPPLDTANTNRILLSMAGVSLLLVFMDVQAGKQIRDRVETLPDKIQEQIPRVQSGVSGLPAKVASLEPPVRQSAAAIFEGAQSRVNARLPVTRSDALDRADSPARPENMQAPDARVRASNGWDLYFVSFKGRESIMVRVHRNWPQDHVSVKTLLQYLQKGPSGRERGLLNPFDSSVKLVSQNLEEGILTLQFDSTLLRMGPQVVRDRMDQVLLTMTQFPEIKGVRFIVPGEDRPYLGKVLRRPARKITDMP